VPIWSGPLDALAEWLEGATLLVNATAVGWHGDALPIPAAMLELLPKDALVYDLTYRDTPLLLEARRLGLDTQDGLEMLVQQGVEAFRLWTGQEPPVDLMRAAAIAGRDA